MKKLKGVITAMTTPFSAEGEIDLIGLKQQVEFAISNGVNALYPTGTTGEMYLMTNEERKLVAEKVVEYAGNRVTVYIHVGAMTLADTILLAQHAHKIGADGIGVVSPSYFSVSDEAIVDYYTAVCSAVADDFPVYAYAIPQLAKNDISPDVVRRICEKCKNLVGIKYSYPDFRRLMEYLTINDGDFSVVFGADDMFLPALIVGADGVVSGCSGPFPEIFSKIYESYCKGDISLAKEQQFYANKIIFAIKAGADMSIFKNILIWRGVNAGCMRAPLKNLNEKDKNELYKKIIKYID